ncbi:hypothetical protein ACOMHN_042586 [Nucella lapillus]
MEINQHIEHLKDLFTLIHPEVVTTTDASVKKDHEERKQQVQTWLDDIVQATSHEENPWNSQEKGRGDTLHLLPQFMRLLRECILTHHWTQVLSMVKCIAHIPYGADWLTWKVLSMVKCIAHIPYGADWLTWKTSLTALYTEPESNASLIKDLFKSSFMLKECNAHNVTLEFVQYLISQDLRQEASKVLQNARRPKVGQKNEHQRELNEHSLTLMDGYQGLVCYVDWKAAVASRQAGSSQSSASGTLTHLSDDAVKKLAKRASMGLDAVVQKSGVWDIFLTKAVEIREVYGEFDKAKELLSTYREKNPDNPNAHKFMYEHLTRSRAHYEDEYGLAKVDPANPLVLTLWQELTDCGSSDQAVGYIFDLLDFEIWRQKHEGWQCLAKSLSTGFSKERSKEETKAFLSALKGCWTTRSDWWPAYHFMLMDTLTDTDQSPSNELLTPKAIIAAVLLGEDSDFITEARKVLRRRSRKGLDQVLSELDWDSIQEFAADCRRPPDVAHPCEKTPLRKSKGMSAAVSPSNRPTSTPVASPLPKARTRRRRGNKDGGDSVTDAETLQAGFSPVKSNPVTDSGSAIAKSPVTNSGSGSPMTKSPVTDSGSPMTKSPVTDSGSASPMKKSPVTDSGCRAANSPVTNSGSGSPTAKSPVTNSGSPMTKSPVTDSGSCSPTAKSPVTDSGSGSPTAKSPVTDSGSPMTKSPVTDSGSPMTKSPVTDSGCRAANSTVTNSGSGSPTAKSPVTDSGSGSPVRKSPVTDSGNYAKGLLKSLSSSGDSVSSGKKPSLGNTVSDLSSPSHSASVVPSPTDGWNSWETNRDNRRQSSAGDKSRFKLKKKEKRKREGSVLKSEETSDVTSNLSRLETLENASNTSPHGKKRKWRADDDEFDFIPVKRWRTKK